MAKKSEMQTTVEKEEQMDLIDVQPENAKEIIEAAQLYKKYQTARLNMLQKEVEQKQRVLELMKAAELQPIDTSGKVIFKSNHFIITIQPRDEKITVKEEDE